MKKTIQLEQKTAQELYGKNPEIDKLLEANFSKEELNPFDWRSITTLEAACKKCGYGSDYLDYRPYETHDEYAYRMLKMVTKAINGEWTPDWSNPNQPKWYNYFGVLPCGSGFSDSSTINYYMITGVGSRLCFESQEKAEFARGHFEDIYKQFLL